MRYLFGCKSPEANFFMKAPPWSDPSGCSFQLHLHLGEEGLKTDEELIFHPRMEVELIFQYHSGFQAKFFQGFNKMCQKLLTDFNNNDFK